MKYLSFVCLLGLLVSCKNEPKMSAPTSETQSPHSLGVYGDTIHTEGALSVADAMEALKTNDSVMCAISGYVTGVCQAKGCWMVLSSNPQDSTGFFVKFRDYGFFVPLDLAGSKVVIKGKAFKEVTSVEELQHYAEDEGKSKEEIALITQPQEEIKFLADGVVVVEGKK
jgi:hypothetical protein